MTKDEVIFPQTEVTITARDKMNTTALLQAVRERQLIVNIPSQNPKDVTGSIGTLLLVRKTTQDKEGVNALVKGLWRVRVERVLEDGMFLRVRFTKAEEVNEPSLGMSRNMQIVLGQIDEFTKLIPGIPREIIETLQNAETPGKLADVCAYSPGFSTEERLDMLRTLAAEERLEKVSKVFVWNLVALRELAAVKRIPECETCMEFADRAFESEPRQGGEIALQFLNHVVQKHTGELLGLLAERYGPEFMRRRALK
jgi:ATP-dependent Lon protease